MLGGTHTVATPIGSHFWSWVASRWVASVRSLSLPMQSLCRCSCSANADVYPWSSSSNDRCLLKTSMVRAFVNPSARILALGIFGRCLWLVLWLVSLADILWRCLPLAHRIALCRLYFEVTHLRIVELHCEIASWDCIMLDRGVALCNMHYADSILRILYWSIMRILLCESYRMDSIVRILISRFHRA